MSFCNNRFRPQLVLAGVCFAIPSDRVFAWGELLIINQGADELPPGIIDCNSGWVVASLIKFDISAATERIGVAAEIEVKNNWGDGVVIGHGSRYGR